MMPPLSILRSLVVLCSFSALVFPKQGRSEQPQKPVVFKSVEQGLAVMIGDSEFTIWRNDDKFEKPFFSPVRASDGSIITRPLDDPSDNDHPHHKGIWLAVDEVNGIKFWGEKGKIVNQEVVLSPGVPASLSLTNHWVGPDGRPILIENSTVSFFPSRLIVYDITLTAVASQVTFKDTKEGWLGIRVAATMRENVGGIVVNSEGKQSAKECWGQPSKWVDYSGPVGGKIYGVAIMDHPSNFRPSRFHVRDYGLFSVSPFGEGAYQDDATKANPVILEKKSPPLHMRYGMYIHEGDAVTGQVAEAREQFLQWTTEKH